jgi:hypothetical protein
MAMTIQQAQMEAMRLRARRPELQNMAVSDLVEQIMATEGAEAPGAGGGGLADIFQPARIVTPSSPAPMQVARLAAPKPTANILPGVGADSFRRAQQVRERTDRGPTVGERSAANARVQELIAGLPTGGGESAPEVVAEARAPAASPVASALAAAKAPAKAKPPSRFRQQFEQKQAELEQLKATIPAGAEIPAELAYEIKNLSGVVSQLQGLVAAEEGAAVDADRAALLERQAARLGREEELVDKARKRAPFDALIAGGAALAAAKPGENLASILARGFQAGSEKYTGARDAREAALRGIEERRDALALQNIDAVQKARDEAIALQNAGMQMTEQQMRLANMTQEGATAAALAPFKVRVGKAEASKAETEALYAPRMAEAELESEGALADYRRRPPQPRGGSGDKGMTENQRQTKISALSKERRGIMIELNDPMTLGPTKAALRVALKSIDGELGELRGTRTNAAPAKAAPAKAAPAKAAPAAGKPPVKGARWSSAKKGWFIPDPNRPGKYLQVFN